MITGNEPAQPTILQNAMNGQPYDRGLTIRQLFAKDAPIEIPSWFTHKSLVREITPAPLAQAFGGQEEIGTLTSWTKDPCWDLEGSLKPYQLQYEKHCKEKIKLQEDNVIERYFQWRTFYADALINELNKTK